MCLTTKDPTIKVAEQDIVVYKYLTYPKVNFLKRLFNPKLASPISTVWGCHRYHREEVQPEVKILPHKEREEDVYTVHEGYHTHAEPDMMGFQCNGKFIIPKGTKYIEGCNNGREHIKNYVSETLIYIGKL